MYSPPNAREQQRRLSHLRYLELAPERTGLLRSPPRQMDRPTACRKTSVLVQIKLDSIACPFQSTFFVHPRRSDISSLSKTFLAFPGQQVLLTLHQQPLLRCRGLYGTHIFGDASPNPTRNLGLDTVRPGDKISAVAGNSVSCTSRPAGCVGSEVWWRELANDTPIRQVEVEHPCSAEEVLFRLKCL